MKYMNTKTERESDSNGSYYPSARRGNVMKRISVLLLMTMCLVFAGARSAPATKASAAGCELVCNDTYTDPKTGQCYLVCCPTSKECMNPCELMPCNPSNKAE